MLSAALAGEETSNYEFPLYTKDDRRVDVLLNATTRRDTAGNIVGVIGVGQDITERVQAATEILMLNEELERHVADRTAQLEAANRELESFSYSVSHDLRAPLRSINGFSRVLEEDFGKQLNETGQGHLGRIRKATEYMGFLIDDLLQLSRMSRGELDPKGLDLSELCMERSRILQESDPDRTVEFAIQAGVKAVGDESLIRAVLDNLLGNAWKFTHKHRTARIEFGASTQDGTTTYFVRDDGAGFEMAYADKLFGAFQRLHDVEDFQGTGIGLATVQRIVNRHGGKIWAEGAVEKGATFYFQLGDGHYA